MHTEIPHRVLVHLLASFASDTATTTLSGSLHPGDEFGQVLCWLWNSGRRDSATALVRDLHAALDEEKTWDRLIDGISLAIPVNTEGDDALLAHLRANPPATWWYAAAETPPTAPILGRIGSGKSVSGLCPVPETTPTEPEG